MIRTDFDDRVYFHSSLLNELETVEHCFTTKCGGVSRGDVSGLNLGLRVGDEMLAVTKNYQLVADDMGFAYDRITAGRQTHSSNIRVITEVDAGKGVSKESEFMDVDGLVTNIRNLPLVVYYADCVPVLLADETAGVVAAVHSGWRGTVARITENAMGIMCQEFGALPERIKVAIGPSIGPCCFETGEEVACEFDGSFVAKKENGKYNVDLWSANKVILEDCGVKKENIEILKLCTICRSDILYSYRVHKEKTGRMGAFIVLR